MVAVLAVSVLAMPIVVMIGLLLLERLERRVPAPPEREERRSGPVTPPR